METISVEYLEQNLDYISERVILGEDFLISNAEGKIIAQYLSEMKEKQIEKAPNLFNYATNELSQDAVICYLAQWADEKNKKFDEERYNLGQSFLQSMLLKSNKHIEILNVEVFKQVEGIDALIKINGGDNWILIEDKTHTSNHGNQLERYLKILADKKINVSDKEKITVDNIVPIYFKTGDQDQFTNESFKLYNRKDLLAVLNPYITSETINKDEIIQQFYNFWHNFDQKRSLYKYKLVANWTYEDFVGFYQYLFENTSNPLNFYKGWNKVNNKSDGFLSFFWGFKEKHTFEKGFLFEPYLQVEYSLLENKIVNPTLNFRIKLSKEETRKSESRNYWTSCLIKSSLINEKPRRYGSGKTMSCGKVVYLICKQNGLIDLDETVLNLNQITERFIHLISQESVLILPKILKQI